MFSSESNSQHSLVDVTIARYMVNILTFYGQIMLNTKLEQDQNHCRVFLEVVHKTTDQFIIELPDLY